jgi:hypothetical protein
MYRSRPGKQATPSGTVAAQGANGGNEDDLLRRVKGNVYIPAGEQVSSVIVISADAVIGGIVRDLLPGSTVLAEDHKRMGVGFSEPFPLWFWTSCFAPLQTVANRRVRPP